MALEVAGRVFYLRACFPPEYDIHSKEEKHNNYYRKFNHAHTHQYFDFFFKMILNFYFSIFLDFYYSLFKATTK